MALKPQDPADFVCIRCGYPLIHTDPKGTCPDCGLRVADSKDQDSVARADRGWVLNMIVAIKWSGYFYIGLFVYGFLGLTVWVAAFGVIFKKAMSSRAKGTVPDLSGMQYVTVLAVVANFCAMAVFLVLMERLTRKEPNRELLPRPVEGWRAIGRIAVWVSAVMCVICMPIKVYVGLTTDYAPAPGTKMGPWPVFVTLLFLIEWGVLGYVFCLIPYDFAKRLSSPTLQNQAKRVLIYAVVAWGGWMIMTPMAMAGTLTGNSRTQLVGGCMSCPFLAIAGVALIAQLVEGIMLSFGIVTRVEEMIKRAEPPSPISVEMPGQGPAEDSR